MEELKDKVKELNQLIIDGDTINAMEIFYSDDIEMQENEDVPRMGKSICIDAERINLEKVKSIESNLLGQAIDEEKNMVFSEWNFLVTYKDNSQFILTEVSVQHWLHGQVVKEKFYYKNFRKVD